MSKRFPYGYDVNVYIDKAIEKMKYLYPWVSKDLLDNRYEYFIKKISNKYQCGYIYHQGKEDYETILDLDRNDFIDYIIWQNEYKVQEANPVKKVFVVPGQEGKCLTGWYLERYEFRSHELGGYSVFCQAGDRVAGGSRTFFIPNEYFDGTYEEFMDKYIELVSPRFGFTKDELLAIPELKKFLGF
jgi:hypothetical protein